MKPGPRRRGLPSGPAGVKRPGLGGAPAPRSGWQDQEKRAADAIGGKRTRGSGSSWRPSQKGDAVGAVFRAETKTTVGKSIGVEKAWLLKIAREAHEQGQRPALVFGFDPVPGAGLCTEDPAAYIAPARLDWIAFQMSDGEAMMRAVEALLQGDIEGALAHARMLR